MAAYLLECLIEAHGHRALCTHLAKPTFWYNLGAAIGCREADPQMLLCLLQRGLTASDISRLRLCVDTHVGQIGDAAGMRVFLPAPLQHNAGPRRLGPPSHEAAAALERRLGAHRALSLQRWPGALAPVSRMPVVGPRTLFALSLWADWLAEPSGTHPLELAFGDPSGDPGPLLLRVYDAALHTLETLLAARTAGPSRLGPLWMLRQRRSQLEPLAQPQGLAKWQQRERKMSRNLLGCGPRGPLEPGTEIPRLWRRPKIGIDLSARQDLTPDPSRWQPDESAAVDDLFLP